MCLQSRMVKEDDEDSFDVNSLELSQKQLDPDQDYYYADGQNKTKPPPVKDD